MIFNSFFGDLIAFIIFIIILSAIYVRYLYTFWSRHGFDYFEPNFIFGNLKRSALLKICIAEDIKRIYDETDKPFKGFFMFWRPALMLKDLDLVKLIAVKDFDYFISRGFYFDEKNDPLSGHLLALSGEPWKLSRQKMTLALTSGKLKHMMPTFMAVSDRLEKYLDGVAERPINNNIEIKSLFACYATDVIASVAFGLDIDSINNPNEMFRVMGAKLADPNLEGKLRVTLAFMIPDLVKLFGIKFNNREVDDFFLSVVRQTIEYRETKNVVRQDLLQLLIQVRNTGTVNEDGVWESTVVSDDKKTLTSDQIAAQCFTFFGAGFETTSSLMTYFIYEISKHQDVQKRLQNEIDTVLAKTNGIVTYDSIKEMTYLEMVADEVLRLYPSVPYMQRQCTTNYKIPNSNLTIPAGTPISFSIMGMHRDPKYFENPDKFDPERFSAENSKKIKPFSYFPFGDGPRVCIGKRLSIVQSRSALATIISKFNFKLANDQTEHVTFDPNGLFLAPEGGIRINIERR